MELSDLLGIKVLDSIFSCYIQTGLTCVFMRTHQRPQLMDNAAEGVQLRVPREAVVHGGELSLTEGNALGIRRFILSSTLTVCGS